MSIITILVGALAISAAFTINQNMEKYVDLLLEQNGGPKLTVNIIGDKSLTEKERKIFSKLSIVKKAYLTDSTPGSLIRINNSTASVELYAVTDEFLKYVPMRIKKGRFLSAPDLTGTAAHVVVSPDTRDRLKTKLLNRYVSFTTKNKQNLSAKVVGIVSTKSQMYDDGKVWLPMSFYKIVTGKSHLQRIEIVATNMKWMDWLENYAKKILETNEFYSYWIQNPFHQFAETQKEMNAFVYIGYVLGAFALLAGCIGATNVMLLNINMRFREIGLYKAIGFSTPIILFQFTSESLILSGAGGLIGSFFGSFIGAGMSRILLPMGDFSFSGVFLGFFSSVIVGGVLGLIPSLKAARLDSVKALQG